MGFLAVFGALGFGRFGYSAILPSMQKDLGITSAAAGSLASWNLGGYVIMAAIGGLLASRFGPRRVVAIGSIVAAAGMFLTGLSNGLVTASAARLLTGLGGGCVLVPSVALMSAWFDDAAPRYGVGDRHLGLVSGAGDHRPGGAPHHRLRRDPRVASGLVLLRGPHLLGGRARHRAPA